MSVAQGHEALDDGPPAPEPQAAPLLPLLPRAIALPPRPPVLSPAGAWLRALRPGTLPVALLGGAVGGLVVARDTATRPGLLALGLLCLALAGVLAGLVRDLGDSRPGRAGPLRRVEAGRAAIVLSVAGLLALGVLVAVRGTAGLQLGLLGAVGLLLAVSRRSGPAVCVLAGLLVGGAGVATAAWAATGRLGWHLLPAALAVGAVTAALLVARRAELRGLLARVLVLAPYAAVGAGVAVAVLPWPALAVGLALPAARRSSVSATRRDAALVVAGHARLLTVLLVAGLLAAAVLLPDGGLPRG
jgi:1,4-dihydroxy-2-naphthoate octaprenyltransferase